MGGVIICQTRSTWEGGRSVLEEEEKKGCVGKKVLEVFKAQQYPSFFYFPGIVSYGIIKMFSPLFSPSHNNYS